MQSDFFITTPMKPSSIWGHKGVATGQDTVTTVQMAAISMSSSSMDHP